MDSISRASQVREEAIALRRAGASGRQIKQILGIGGGTLAKAVAGVPAPDWTRRPLAKDDLRAEARSLRAQGWSYSEIVAELSVSKSSVSLWVRDMPPLDQEAVQRRKAAASRRYWDRERHNRAIHREAEITSHAAAFGTFSDRDLLIAGTIAYWCEGAKARPGRGAGRVTFINSDPGLVVLFLRFLGGAGIGIERLSFRVMIHETADVAAAQQFWQEVTGMDRSRFRKPTLKPGNARTIRKNVGASYHGCLVIDVRRSAELYRKIEGWVRGIIGTVPDGSGRGATRKSAAPPSATAELGGETLPHDAHSSRPLREDAVALRLAGKSRREIKQILGIASNQTLNLALRDVPPPAWPVQRGSRLSYAENRRRAADGVRRYWATERRHREVEREAVRVATAAEIGGLTDRELLIAGAVAYWCEGAKSKSYRPSERVTFVNSDPALISMFLRFLDRTGIDPGRLLFRVLIHESADVAAADRFWLAVTDADYTQFRPAALKRHVPRTARKHANSDYHGCLTISVRRSARLYREIEALMCTAAAGQVPKSDAPRGSPGPIRTRTQLTTGENPNHQHQLPEEDSNLHLAGPKPGVIPD